MDVVELLPRLHLLRFPVGQAYLWRDGDDLTLIDAGPAGSAASISAYARGRLRRIVLTHFHKDHAGGAGELAALTGAEVLAHHLDAPIVRGEVPARRRCWRTGSALCTPRPYGASPEVPLCARRRSPRCPTALHSTSGRGPGRPRPRAHGRQHRPPSPEVRRVVHGRHDRRIAGRRQRIPGVFNLDRSQVLAACHRLAALDADVACFGHGAPVIGRAGAALREAADTYGSRG
ncbi:hypothetical protein SALBM311S_10465 [Streptomyces alboniger]